ncbi:hypothetical protein DFP90_110127 [Aestuariispira insulae]|uniref:Uncharacterized protein n=2 Tax=Aestuariispira insulae TaxID=1461337 RepID=A0A3D9H9Q3_9PROT|nr:hypothetical protein DFP90_110127 [Aestuariispira insulae]
MYKRVEELVENFVTGLPARERREFADFLQTLLDSGWHGSEFKRLYRRCDCVMLAKGQRRYHQWLANAVRDGVPIPPYEPK